MRRQGWLFVCSGCLWAVLTEIAIRTQRLAYLRRRRKSLVPEKHKRPRMSWGRFVKAQSAAMLGKWVYSDGTVFYLARTEGEQELGA